MMLLKCFIQYAKNLKNSAVATGLEKDRLFFLGSKVPQMVTAAMKLKDAYSLEGKL